MPIYEYTALNSKGKTITDIIDAEGISAARQKLRSSRIYPISIKEVYETGARHSENVTRWLKPFSGRVSPAELAIMTRQLATLIGAGFPLVSALYTLIPQTRSHTLKQALARMKDNIEGGSSFAAALGQYPEIFSGIYVNMVGSGESSGTLELVLNRLADITERQQAISNSVRSAIAYPVLMLFVGVLILIFLLTYIVPSITSIFQDMNQALPLPTRMLINVSEFLKNGWWIVLLTAAAAVIAIRRIKRTERGGYELDRLILKLPLAGELKTKLATARFARTLGSLLENGVSLMAALGIVKNIVGNRVIAESIENAALNVEKGGALANSLESSNVFPHIPIQMIQVGENSGELEAMLAKIADIYESEVETSVSTMTALLEPLIILFMGLVVGFIVLSICLPIFEMNQLIG
ncbi:MAG: type II secretion system inner membrane protein GspF [Desulfobacteraceae bacterium]|nr:type II secretion system inner membrane protein GspF [Desulfobacteraceae bacterium]MCF8094901.1 type II secretion system inner membrane protein GspF [Desulfobacteraceae bacterium]